MSQTPDLNTHIGQARMRGEAICAAMENELHQMGFTQAADLAKHFAQAHFELSRDPYDGRNSLKGVWLNAKGHEVGSILFYPDGAFYAEYDVVLPHPQKSKWFVEAITAWGRGDQVKTEARLLPNLS